MAEYINEKTSENKKLSDQVIRHIQQMILDGELSEGDKLPPEREMTERFSIGRPALREARKRQLHRQQYPVQLF